MNKPDNVTRAVARARTATWWLVAMYGFPLSSATQPVPKAALVDITPALLDETGICLEAKRYLQGVRLTIRIPALTTVGKVSNIFMSVHRDYPRDTIVSMELKGYEGNWVTPLYVEVGDLSEYEGEFKMEVGFVVAETRQLTVYRFSNLKFEKLLAMENDDDEERLYRVGCRRWDLENAERQIGDH